jgi:hypothetical protein
MGKESAVEPHSTPPTPPQEREANNHKHKPAAWPTEPKQYNYENRQYIHNPRQYT